MLFFLVALLLFPFRGCASPPLFFPLGCVSPPPSFVFFFFLKGGRERRGLRSSFFWGGGLRLPSCFFFWQCSVQFWRTHHDSGAKLFAYLADQSILLYSKTQVWKCSCQDPIPPEFQDKVTLTLSCLGGHLQFHGDTEPNPVVLGEQATMEKTTQRFQKIPTTLTDLNAEGLNVQTVNDPAHHVRWCCQVNMFSVRALCLNKRLKTSTDRLSPIGPVSCTVTLPLRCFSISQAWWTRSGICGSTSCGCSMACVAVDHSFIVGYNPISGHRFTFSFFTATTCPTRRQMNKPTFQLKPLGDALPPPNHPKETSLHHPKKHPQAILEQPH